MGNVALRTGHAFCICGATWAVGVAVWSGTSAKRSEERGGLRNGSHKRRLMPGRVMREAETRRLSFFSDRGQASESKKENL
jgi:hypothetical protein